MSQVQISPHVEVQELRAIEASLRNRNLLLAQAVDEARTLLAEKEAQLASVIEELERLKALTETPVEERSA
ncbi:hypothetical protein [Shinella sp. BYT-45]|uniref:hypothetical protein n=1 Tax=Shinella sp. BYT-45 TaxID=3377377 RepID=UPI0039818EE5